MTLIRSFQPTALVLSLALLLVLMASPALTEESGEGSTTDKNAVRPYIEYMVGVSIVPNQTISGAGSAGAGLQGRSESDPPGYFFAGAVGARFLEHFRTELQIGYRSTEIDHIAVSTESSDSKGDLSLFSIIANGYVDWDLGVGVIPFVGVGIGWGMPRLDVQNQAGATQLSIDDTDSVFVWNAMVGGTYPISEIADLSLGYRYIATEDFSLRSTRGTTAQKVDFEYDAHEIYLGLRFNF